MFSQGLCEHKDSSISRAGSRKPTDDLEGGPQRVRPSADLHVDALSACLIAERLDHLGHEHGVQLEREQTPEKKADGRPDPGRRPPPRQPPEIDETMAGKEKPAGEVGVSFLFTGQEVIFRL